MEKTQAREKFFRPSCFFVSFFFVGEAKKIYNKIVIMYKMFSLPSLHASSSSPPHFHRLFHVQFCSLFSHLNRPKRVWDCWLAKVALNGLKICDVPNET